MTLAAKIVDRGLTEYEISYHEMRDFTATRDATTQDEIWWLEHPPVFTLGTNGNPDHLLNPGDIPIVETDRGGQVTYHGPGQLVVYILLDLKRANLGVKELVCRLERSIISMLDLSGIEAAGKEGAPGVYVDGAKIASIGLRIRHQCSYHGIALNVDLNAEHFQRINPCGYPGLSIVNTANLGGPTDCRAAAAQLLPEIQRELYPDN